MSFETKCKFISEQEYKERTKDFTGIVLIKDSSAHHLCEKYVQKLLPNNYLVFDLKFVDEKLEKSIPISIGINLYKYKDGILQDHKNMMLGYITLKEWVQDLIK